MSDAIERKLSAKVIMGRKIRAPEKEMLLFSIFGIASGIISGESNFGPWVALIGQFEAINLETGEAFQSGKAFLPEPVHSMIAAQIKSDSKSSVQFGYNVGVKPADTSIGYEYYVTALVKASENDALSRLRDEVQGKIKGLLPAPNKAEPAAKTGTGKK